METVEHIARAPARSTPARQSPRLQWQWSMKKPVEEQLAAADWEPCGKLEEFGGLAPSMMHGEAVFTRAS